MVRTEEPSRSALRNVRHRSQAEYEREVAQGARKKVTFAKPNVKKESRQPPEKLCGKDKQVVSAEQITGPDPGINING